MPKTDNKAQEENGRHEKGEDQATLTRQDKDQVQPVLFPASCLCTELGRFDSSREKQGQLKPGAVQEEGGEGL